jgi:hypothetical protein
MKKLQFTLSFDENLWVCYNNQINLVADSLDEIDNSIETYLKKNYKKGQFEVAMHFDFDKFPTWMRQYMPHYFNRNLHFQID